MSDRPPSPRRTASLLGACAVLGLVVGLAIHFAGRFDHPTDGPIDCSPNEVSSGDVPDGAPGIVRAPPAAAAPVSYHDGIMRAAPSVVSVYTDGGSSGASGTSAADATGAPGVFSQGSGVVVGRDGVVLTNLHLVERAGRITVVLSDGRSYAGTLVGSDRETDLAVVRIPASGLPAMALDEAPPLRVGDVVLAIGNPYGVGQTVTLGIVSATRRRIQGGSAWQNFVQIDAAINPGNSGGALIDPSGRLVGVNTAVFLRDGGAQGIGFAIPADLLAQVVPQIVADGRVVRGWLGVGVDEIAMFPLLANEIDHGAVITGVQVDGPAARAGLRREDVVLAVDGRPVPDATSLLLAISSVAPGAEVTIDVYRDGVESRHSVRLAERPASLERGAPVAPR